jgi:hypothetical protein
MVKMTAQTWRDRMTYEQNKAPPHRRMKAKTIKAVISKKMKQWHESIGDDTVREFVKKNTIVTGGCIASMLLGENVNDFDLYFTNKETVLAVAKYYVEAFNRGADSHLANDE